MKNYPKALGLVTAAASAFVGVIYTIVITRGIALILIVILVMALFVKTELDECDRRRP